MAADRAVECLLKRDRLVAAAGLVCVAGLARPYLVVLAAETVARFGAPAGRMCGTPMAAAGAAAMVRG